MPHLEKKLNIVAVVQARMGSSRLPGKVLKEVNGSPLIQILLQRLSQSKLLNRVVVATTASLGDGVLIDKVRECGYEVVIGDEDDVLSRYAKAASETDADIIVRITGDCPLVDSKLVDDCIKYLIDNNLDCVSNAIHPTFPDGLDVSAVRRWALDIANAKAIAKYDREHVMPYIYGNPLFKIGELKSDNDYSNYRWTVDDPEDLIVITNIFNRFNPNIFFSWDEVLRLTRLEPKLFSPNSHIVRDEGSLMTKGQKLWRRAKKVIPGGNMLLSKRPEMFLPDHWPSYFSRAKGCKVWDLDGNEYVDMSIMGIGTNILGYGYSSIDQAVLATVHSGNMSTLNCPEEVYLCEKLIELHPWAEMVRLSRSGGEANAIAIRIARAATGKDNIAICGYHGWHDWYLATNLGDEKNLDGHLLPGLEPKGVPRNLKGTVFPFRYNNYDELEQIVNNHDIGTIKLEVQRNEEPKDNFLQKVRDLATRKNIVLIFDECTSGFRETYGGLHKKYGIYPDMAMFGKALGNGYAITAVIGKREIMESAQTSFISSTFWTERIGPSAALKTLEVMGDLKSWKVITDIGINVKAGWQGLADKYGVKIQHSGISALASFNFESSNALAYKTLFTQEMLAKGYLASNSVYACIDHTPQVIDKYFEEVESVFSVIGDCEKGADVFSLLNGPICHGGFKRLN